MRKRTIFSLVLSCLCIVCLLALACFITFYNHYDVPETATEVILAPSESEELLLKPGEIITSHSSDNPCYGDDNYMEAEHSFIFVGDSRTVGMRDAVRSQYPDDTCQFIAKSGEGFYWLYNEGIVSLEEALAETPDATVIFNMGVNDLKDVNDYISFYKDLFSEYHDPHFYIMSVNPVVDEECSGASNQEIEAFNNAMLEAFPDKYLDCYHYLLSEDFKTVDGLHYPNSVYCKIHHFIVIMLKNQSSLQGSN